MKALKISMMKNFLLAIKQILVRNYSPSDQSKLSKKQIQSIEELKQQIKQGNFLTNEEADKLVNGWINKH